jgi:hypothetical protein
LQADVQRIKPKFLGKFLILLRIHRTLGDDTISFIPPGVRLTIGKHGTATFAGIPAKPARGKKYLAAA